VGVDWGIDWQDDLSLHKHNTSVFLYWVLSSLGPLNILTSFNRSLEIVGALNDLMLQSRESLSSWLWPQLKLQMSRMEHRSS
jgi:hypothetical protein